MKTQLRWKFLRTGLKSNSGDHTWTLNEWYKHEGKLSICNSGFHCSKEIGQAFSYVGGEYLAQVEVKGKCDEQKDKEAWTEMRIVKVWEWTKKDSVEIAIFAAEQVIEIYEKKYPDDKRPREAINAAKAWLKNPTDAAARAARAAADAAGAAAYAAYAAAYAAYAAADAARAAAYAAYAAADAAYAAADAARAAAGAARAAADAAYAAEAAAAAYAAYAAAAAAYAADAAADASRAADAASYAASRAADAAVLKTIYARFDEQVKKLKKYDNKA